MVQCDRLQDVMRSDLRSHFPGVLLFLDGPCNLLTGCQHHLSTIFCTETDKKELRERTLQTSAVPLYFT